MKENCWEYMKCGREAGGDRVRDLGLCPVAMELMLDGLHEGKNAGRACWIIARSRCMELLSESFNCGGLGACSDCGFYRKVIGEEYPHNAPVVVEASEKSNKVLIVEDEAIIAIDLKTRLERMGFEVAAVAATGERAMEKVEEVRPDLVLMDVVIRGTMNGIEAAARIRSEYDIPVIYITAYSDDSILNQMKKTDPFGYLIKPFEDKQLCISCEIALFRRSRGNELAA